MAATSAAAWAASSLITTWSNSCAAATSVWAMLNLRAIGLVRLGAASAQALGELGHGRRSDEHRHRLGQRPPHRSGADELDLEDHVVAAGEVAVDLGAERPVQVATVFYPLEKSALLSRALELGAAQKVILAAVELARPGPASRGRHRRDQTVEPLLDEGDDGPLPGAGRPRDHEDRGDGVTLRSRRAARRAGVRTSPRWSCSG